LHWYLKFKTEGLVIESLERKIIQLNNELFALKAERDSLNEKAQAWAKKRDKIHEEIRKIRLEAKGFKDQRDELNAEIKFLKVMRNERSRKRAEIIEKIKIQKQKIKVTSSTMTARSLKWVEDEIAKIEWNIQTEPHSLEEEKNLVNHVKTLALQLQAYKQTECVRKQIADLEAEAQALKAEIQSDGNKILELAQQSQKFHERMIKNLEKAKTLKTEADKLHHKYVEIKEESKTRHSKYIETLNQLKDVYAVIQQKEEEEKTKQQAILKKRVEEEALDKLKQGKKLSFEEFKFLAEQGKI